LFSRPLPPANAFGSLRDALAHLYAARLEADPAPGAVLAYRKAVRAITMAHAELLAELSKLTCYSGSTLELERTQIEFDQIDEMKGKLKKRDDESK
jgi:hypothetical protein